MIRFNFVAAAAALALVSTAALAGTEAAPSSSSGYSCKNLPEIKAAAAGVVAKQVDRDRIAWQVKQADRLCTEGKEQQAKGYLDLAHSLVLKDHSH